MVCPCLKVCKDDIVEAIDNGASNFKDVKKKTKNFEIAIAKNKKVCYNRKRE